VENISNKMHAAIWVGGALFVMWYSDFWRLLWADPRVNRCVPSVVIRGWCSDTCTRSITHAPDSLPSPRRIALDISLVCDGVFVAIGFYLAVWLRYIKGNKLEWRVIAPRAIPTATVFSVVAVITCVRVCLLCCSLFVLSIRWVGLVRRSAQQRLMRALLCV